MMSDHDWQDALRERYPWASQCSFAVGDGWRELVERTFARIDALKSSRGPEDPDLALRAYDVKEKYASLRIDIVPYDEEAEAIVEAAENESETICDVCGSPGSVRGEHWISTRCETHAPKQSS
jgi:hypothetical protein